MDTSVVKLQKKTVVLQMMTQMFNLFNLYSINNRNLSKHKPYFKPKKQKA